MYSKPLPTTREVIFYGNDFAPLLSQRGIYRVEWRDNLAVYGGEIGRAFRRRIEQPNCRIKRDSALGGLLRD